MLRLFLSLRLCPPSPACSTPPTPLDRRWLECCIARRSCVFYAVLIHLAASSFKHVAADRRLDVCPEEQGRGGHILAWVGRALPCPALAPPDAFGQMDQTYRPLFIKRTCSPRLAMAPSTTSQWNQRKLAPNYRLISVKDGTGGAGVSVCGGWVAESLWDRGPQSRKRTRRTHTEARDTITRAEKQKAQPPFSGPFVPQPGLLPSSRCHSTTHLCPVSDPTGLITHTHTHTPEDGASGFYAAYVPLRKQ